MQHYRPVGSWWNMRLWNVVKMSTDKWLHHLFMGIPKHRTGAVPRHCRGLEGWKIAGSRVWWGQVGSLGAPVADELYKTDGVLDSLGSGLASAPAAEPWGCQSKSFAAGVTRVLSPRADGSWTWMIFSLEKGCSLAFCKCGSWKSTYWNSTETLLNCSNLFCSFILFDFGALHRGAWCCWELLAFRWQAASKMDPRILGVLDALGRESHWDGKPKWNSSPKFFHLRRSKDFQVKI